jgi:hypothetical protein
MSLGSIGCMKTNFVRFFQSVKISVFQCLPTEENVIRKPCNALFARMIAAVLERSGVSSGFGGAAENDLSADFDFDCEGVFLQGAGMWFDAQTRSFGKPD